MTARLFAALFITATFGSTAHAQIRAQDAHVATMQDQPALELSVGAGAEGFIGTTIRGAIPLGENWVVRAAYGKRKSVRVEAAYTGSRQPIDFMAASASLTSTGLVAMLRINVYPEGRIEPFFLTGAGWTRFTVSGSQVAGLASADDVATIPLGFGGAYQLGSFSLDLRAVLTIVTGPDLLAEDPPPQQASEDSEMMHRYGVNASLGYSF